MRRISRRRVLQLGLGSTSLLAGCTSLRREADPVEEVWTATTQGNLEWRPTVHDGSVYVSDWSGSITSFDAGAGEEQWHEQPIYESRLTTPVAVNDDRVYAGGRELHAYSTDGTRKWSTSLREGGTRSHRGLSVADGRLFSGIASGEFCAFDSESGTVLWREDSSDERSFRPTSVTSYTIEDGTVYVGNRNGAVLAFDEATGTIEWERVLTRSSDVHPTVKNGTVYVASDDLYALDSTTGETIWEESIEGRVSSPLTVQDDRVYARTTDRSRIVAVNAETGEERWSFTSDTDGEAFEHAPAPASGTVYVGSIHGRGNEFAGRLRSFDVDGTKRWTYKIEEPIQAAPVVVDEMIYTPGQYGRLSAFEERI